MSAEVAITFVAKLRGGTGDAIERFQCPPQRAMEHIRRDFRLVRFAGRGGEIRGENGIRPDQRESAGKVVVGRCNELGFRENQRNKSRTSRRLSDDRIERQVQLNQVSVSLLRLERTSLFGYQHPTQPASDWLSKSCRDGGQLLEGVFRIYRDRDPITARP